MCVRPHNFFAAGFQRSLDGWPRSTEGRSSLVACPRSAGQRPVTTLITPDRCPVPQRVVASPGPMNSMRLI